MPPYSASCQPRALWRHAKQETSYHQAASWNLQPRRAAGQSISSPVDSSHQIVSLLHVTINGSEELSIAFLHEAAIVPRALESVWLPSIKHQRIQQERCGNTHRCIHIKDMLEFNPLSEHRGRFFVASVLRTLLWNCQWKTAVKVSPLHGGI